LVRALALEADSRKQKRKNLSGEGLSDREQQRDAEEISNNQQGIVWFNEDKALLGSVDNPHRRDTDQQYHEQRCAAQARTDSSQQRVFTVHHVV
jgi:hypothetical protein